MTKRSADGASGSVTIVRSDDPNGTWRHSPRCPETTWYGAVDAGQRHDEVRCTVGGDVPYHQRALGIAAGGDGRRGENRPATVVRPHSCGPTPALRDERAREIEVSTRAIQRVARASSRAWRVASSSRRRLPDFIVIGAQKSGTSSLYAHIVQHPRVDGARYKELHYFDDRHHLGPAWYRSNFPVQRRVRPGEPVRLCGEATPAYLFHPAAAERAAALVPEARCIAVLRNPVDRAYSNYQHEVAHGREPLTFLEAIDTEEERVGKALERARADHSAFDHAIMHHSYLARGRYVEQLEEWLRHYPREQLLVIQAERLIDTPAQEMATVWTFLGLHPDDDVTFPHANARPYEPLDEQLRSRLTEYFAPHNERLFELLGQRFDW